MAPSPEPSEASRVFKPVASVPASNCPWSCPRIPVLDDKGALLGDTRQVNTMSSLPKKKYGNVNLGFMDPVETLNPDSLKLFSKEELSAYLQYYGMLALKALLVSM